MIGSLEHLKATWAVPRVADDSGAAMTFPVLCRFSDPVAWDPAAFEAAGFTLPGDLVAFWGLAGGATLFEDVAYGQWGVALFSPLEAMARESRTAQSLVESLEDGDLVIGRFLGDDEGIVIRCRPGELDHGAIVIALPDYDRPEWLNVARSLDELVGRLTERPTSKYWEHRTSS